MWTVPGSFRNVHCFTGFHVWLESLSCWQIKLPLILNFSFFPKKKASCQATEQILQVRMTRHSSICFKEVSPWPTEQNRSPKNMKRQDERYPLTMSVFLAAPTLTWSLKGSLQEAQTAIEKAKGNAKFCISAWGCSLVLDSVWTDENKIFPSHINPGRTWCMCGSSSEASGPVDPPVSCVLI